MGYSGIEPTKVRWSTEVGGVEGAGDMAQAVITSSPIGLATIRDAGIQLIWTGTPTGTFTFEISNDFNPREQNAFAAANTGTWTPLTVDRAPTNPAGSAANTAMDLSTIPYRWVRAKYTRTGSSGTLTGWVSGKSV